MFTHDLRAAALAAALLPTWGIAAPLTLDQAMELAAQRSASMRAAQAGASSAAEAGRAAGQLPDPMLTVGVENLPVTGADRFTTRDAMTMKRVGLSQEWLSPDKRAARQAAAQALADREATLASIAAAEARLQTALAFIDAHYATEALRLATLTAHHVHEELEAAKARLSSAAASSQEVLALTSAHGVAEDESAEVRQTQGAARVALQRWVGMPADELAAPIVAQELGEATFVAHHPAVLAAQRDVDIARREASVAQANRRPNWTWEVSYGQRTGYPDMVSVGVSIPLQLAPSQRQDRETAARLALVDKAEALLAEATRVATAEHQALTSDATRLAERIERYRASVVAPAQQRTAAALAGYRSNQTALMALFEARHAEVEVQRKLLTLQRDLAKTQAQLAFKAVIEGGVR